MTKALLLVLFVSLFLSAESFAAKKAGAFAPENGMWIDVDDKAAGGITQVEFTKVINDINKIYAPIVKAKGGKLKIQKNWTDGTVNAYASREGKNTWLVAMFGGLARYNMMTADGFSLVVCHELSHHLGGAPKYAGEDWASNEGQSDYIGTMKCMREVFKTQDNAAALKKIVVDPIVTKKCNAVYKDAKLAAICMRSAMAGKVLADVLNDLGQGQIAVSFATPDSHVVSQTADEHPEAQCRLDTYLAGALCNKDLTDSVSETDALKGTCNTSQGAKVGVRPLCWYKP